MLPVPSNMAPHLPFPNLIGTTRSQRLFSITTGIDPHLLTISSGGNKQEFFTFMELREKLQWTSFKMTNFDWVCAVSSYNIEIDKINTKHRKHLPMKTPHVGQNVCWP